MTLSGTVSVESDLAFKAVPMTAMQRVMGFRASEEIYDRLTLKDQLIVDLLAMGWQQYEIAELFEVNRSWVSIRLRQIRAIMATTQLKKNLEIRQEIKSILRGDDEFNY